MHIATNKYTVPVNVTDIQREQLYFNDCGNNGREEIQKFEHEQVC